MESPYYEMTHDFEEENRIASESFSTGYMQGHIDGANMIIRYLVDMPDEDLVKWKHAYKERYTNETSNTGASVSRD